MPARFPLPPTRPDHHRLPERHRPQCRSDGRRPPDADAVGRPEPRHPVPAGTYDNELLDLHFICGDGRCNENIALTAIHQIFHSEHDRLVAYVKNVLPTDTSGITILPTGRPRSARRTRRLERRAPLPGRPLRHRDAVPAPRVRGVRPEDPARDQPVRALRLSTRPTSTRPSPPSSPTPSTGSATRC